MSLISNLDNKLSDAERIKLEREERHTEIVDSHIANSEDYRSQGFLNPRHATVSKKMDTWGADDVRKRRAAGKPVLPAFIVEQPDGEVTYILTEADGEAVSQGYICENCLGWQESNLSLECKTTRGFSCGYRKGT